MRYRYVSFLIVRYLASSEARSNTDKGVVAALAALVPDFQKGLVSNSGISDLHIVSHHMNRLSHEAWPHVEVPRLGSAPGYLEQPAQVPRLGIAPGYLDQPAQVLYEEWNRETQKYASTEERGEANLHMAASMPGSMDCHNENLLQGLLDEPFAIGSLVDLDIFLSLAEDRVQCLKATCSALQAVGFTAPCYTFL